MGLIKDLVFRLLFSQRTFELLQRFKIHLTYNHYYSPIPDTNSLRDDFSWEQEIPLHDIDWNEASQLTFLKTILPRYVGECNFPLNAIEPQQYYINNGTYGWVSAVAYHGVIRHHKPERVFEIGSGMTTYVARRALAMNNSEGHAGKITIIDPEPRVSPDNARIMPKKVESLSADFFETLERGDILFIDSTHTVRIGGDVLFLFLEVLPILNKGVLVHFHDIFLPYHYPQSWIVERRYFWAEQYLLQAFLAYNERFQVVWAGNYLVKTHLEDLKSAIPQPKFTDLVEDERTRRRLKHHSSSFWMQVS